MLRLTPSFTPDTPTESKPDSSTDDWSAPRLEVTTPDGAVQRRPFPKPGSALLVGRSKRKTDLILDDEHVSKRHARFYEDDEAAFVEDLASLHGTCVNGIRINAPTRLRHGDVVQIGGSTLRYQCYRDKVADALQSPSGEADAPSKVREEPEAGPALPQPTAVPVAATRKEEERKPAKATIRPHSRGWIVMYIVLALLVAAVAVYAFLDLGG